MNSIAMTTVKNIIERIELAAPLRFQDDFDNSGLQVGEPDAPVEKILVCLDVTEAVVDEAIRLGCGMIVSHHPLIFRALKQVSGFTYQQRCAISALRHNIAIYSAHTSLDNAPGGVNHRIAEIIGMEDCRWLLPKEGMDAGSGLVGSLREPMKDEEFFAMLAERFEVEGLRHSEADGRTVRRVALCGGAGAFLLPQAMAAGADVFVCGEFHYHDYFENDNILLAELGHYQSEQYTQDLLAELLKEAFPQIEIIHTGLNTNPIRYKHKI